MHINVHWGQLKSTWKDSCKNHPKDEWKEDFERFATISLSSGNNEYNHTWEKYSIISIVV